MSETQARRLAAMLTDKQRRDFLKLAQIIQESEHKKPAAGGAGITPKALASQQCGAKTRF